MTRWRCPGRAGEQSDQTNLRDNFLLSAHRSYHKSLPWRGAAMMSLVRRSLAVMIAALLAGVLAAAGISVPANAAPKGSLEIVSVTDTASGLGAPVQNRPFNVAVRILDNAGQPMTVNQATRIALEEVSGPGVLGGTTTAVIPRNGSSATISGATYSLYANGVVLRVRAVSGVDLSPDDVTVDVALTAVGANA